MRTGLRELGVLELLRGQHDLPSAPLLAISMRSAVSADWIAPSTAWATSGLERNRSTASGEIGADLVVALVAVLGVDPPAGTKMACEVVHIWPEYSDSVKARLPSIAL